MVFHPGYDRWRYGDNQDTWLTHSVESWQWVLERAEPIGCVVAVENIFEEEPSTLRALLEAVELAPGCATVSTWDTGTCSRRWGWRNGLRRWGATSPRPISTTTTADGTITPRSARGTSTFELFFRLMEQYAPDAAWTIEAHSREKLERALINLQDYSTE